MNDECVDPFREWIEAMHRGDFASAWSVSDRILRQRIQSGQSCWDWPRHQQFVWRGEPLDGKRVLVRCYHGLGDTIQYIRFLEPLREIARETVIWVQPELLSLVATAPGVDAALPLHDGSPDVRFDVDIEIMELPHALRFSAGQVTGRVPYLHACPPLSNNGVGPRAKIGLVWRAGSWDPRRSIPIDALTPLADLTEIGRYSLQLDASLGELARLAAIDRSARRIEEVAACMTTLDLVITVDTMTAHLAGALGHPVWTLLHADCDWRWMRRRTDTPWYPTMRLFRQRRPGDWQQVVNDVAAELICMF